MTVALGRSQRITFLHWSSSLGGILEGEQHYDADYMVAAKAPFGEIILR